MSTIQIQREWQPEPTKSLVRNYPVQEGTKFHVRQQECIVCSIPKVPYVFGQEKIPLVMACPKCGHKSWAQTAQNWQKAKLAEVCVR
ncbi:hypothetical protein [Candidatus Nitrosotenuis uzonensis]|nr:hypothetical protein [Candidatus Nitrosotenuis uzonensis]